MANKSISMIQVRRIVQLKAEGLSKLKISESLHIHRATLDNYLSKLGASGKSFTELLDYNDKQLVVLVYGSPATPKADNRIDDLKKHLDYFKAELSRPGVTRKILWEEYQLAYPEGYGYTQFCEHFARHINVPKPQCTLPIVRENTFKLILPERNCIMLIYKQEKLYHALYWFVPYLLADILT